VTSRIKFYVVFAMRKWKNPPSFYLCFFAKILFPFLQELFARMYTEQKQKKVNANISSKTCTTIKNTLYFRKNAD
jgi:hypothetical protein